MLSAIRTTVKNAFETNLPRTALHLRVLRYIHWRPHETELALVAALVQPGTDAADVGANTGLFAWQIARFARQCYCFEPHPHLASYLKRALPANCRVIGAGVSDAPGTAELQVPWVGGRYNESLASLDRNNTAQFTRVDRRQVDLVTLDDTITTSISFLNIDVEGHELAVLKGALNLLKAQRPAVLVEIEQRHNPQSFGLVTALFGELGYEGFFYRDRSLKPVAAFDPMRDQDVTRVGTPAYINNFLFLHRDAARPALPA